MANMSEHFDCKIIKYQSDSNNIPLSFVCEYKSKSCNTIMTYCFDNVKSDDFSKLIDCMKLNSDYKIKFNPGPNRWAEISTTGGYTIFQLRVDGDGSGNDNPVAFSFCIKNNVCLDAFINVKTVDDDTDYDQ